MKSFRTGVSIVAAIAVSLLLAACPAKKAEEASAPVTDMTSNTNTSIAIVSEPVAEIVESTPVVEVPAPISSSSVPVECEDYAKQVIFCADKLGVTGEMLKKNLEDAKVQWANISDSEVLAHSCKKMSDQFAISSKAAGC